MMKAINYFIYTVGIVAVIGCAVLFGLWKNTERSLKDTKEQLKTSEGNAKTYYNKYKAISKRYEKFLNKEINKYGRDKDYRIYSYGFRTEYDPDSGKITFIVKTAIVGGIGKVKGTEKTSKTSKFIKIPKIRKKHRKALERILKKLQDRVKENLK